LTGSSSAAVASESDKPNDLGANTIIALLRGRIDLTIIVVGTGFMHVENAHKLYDKLELTELERLIWMPVTWVQQPVDEEFPRPSWHNMLDTHPHGLTSAAAAVMSAHECNVTSPGSVIRWGVT
jgi:hypothetical protein